MNIEAENYDPTSFLYVLNGSNFKHSAELLAETIEKDKDGTPHHKLGIPFYFLASHSAELFLKACLLKSEFENKKLKKYEYRHNLDALLNEVINLGIVVSEKTKITINSLNAQHEKHKLRYNEFEKINRPSLGDVQEMLNELMGLTREYKKINDRG